MIRVICLAAILLFQPLSLNAQKRPPKKPKPVNSLLMVGGTPQHIKGINLTWLNGAYGHDFGHLPNHPDWGISFNEPDLTNYFSDMRRMDLNVVRIFVFEDLEGLVFDKDGYVTGLDPTLLSNFDKAMKIAREKKLHLYLSLANNFSKACVRSNYKNIIVNQIARSRYVENAVKPFAKRYKEDNTIFAFEVMSEPEHEVAGDRGNWTKDGCSWEQMRAFIKHNVGAIHSVDKRRMVSCGSGWHSYENLKDGYYNNLGFDFYDYHERLNDDYRALPVAELNLDRPVIIGEFNIPPDQNYGEERQKREFAEFLQKIKANGYVGALVWNYDFPGQHEKESKELSMLRGDGSAEWKPACYILRDFKWKD